MTRKTNWQRRRSIGLLLLQLLIAAGILCGIPGWCLANPSDGTVSAGTGSISASGSTTTINQTSDKLAVNWRSFNIGAGETVQFIQPGVNSIALNRVIGSDPSAIYGTLSANGKVFLINPNGILFGPSAQVNVGGLVASTLNLTDSDFLSGNYTFSGNSGHGVINQGQIGAADGGYVALLGAQASNEGLIVANRGTVSLGAGSQITLDFYGDGLFNLAVDQAAVNALVENKQLAAIQADGGRVMMTAKAADALAGTVVNNSGMIRAQSISDVNGAIILDGGTNGTVSNSGTLDASGKNAGETGGTVKVLSAVVTLADGATVDVSGEAGGGTILIGGNFQGRGPEQNAITTYIGSNVGITANAITSGDGGKVIVWADDATNFAGTIAARGGVTGGDGGNVEVSGKQKLTYQGTTDLTAIGGVTGTLLLDPNDFTVAASGGDMTGTALGNALNSANVTITTTAAVASESSGTAINPNGTAGGHGDININDGVSWNGGNLLTLSAYNNINLNAAISNHPGVPPVYGGLTLTANTSGSGNGISTGIISATADVNVGYFTLGGGTWRQIGENPPMLNTRDFRISGGTFIRALGGDGSSGDPYRLTDVYGLQGIDSSGMLGKSYILANDINAAPTINWNGGAGFKPVGNEFWHDGESFTGVCDGMGHIINALYIHRPESGDMITVGLFGYNFGTIRNMGLTNVNITGNDYVGGLAGDNLDGTIENCYSTGAVIGHDLVGGLVGVNQTNIANCYSTSAVTGHDLVGGLAGNNVYNLSMAYPGRITNCFSTGVVNGSSNVGGLVGRSNSANITNCYWDITTSGRATSDGGSGLTTADMKKWSTFHDAGWNIASSGGSNAIWRIYDGQSYPLLRAFLAPLTITANNVSRTYDGTSNGNSNGVTLSDSWSGLLNDDAAGYDSTSQNAVNAGTYTITPTGYCSTSQFGYDITFVSGTLTINRRPVTVTPDAGRHRVYDGTAETPTLTYSIAPPTATTGLVTGESLSGVLTRDAGKDAANYAILQGTVTNANNANYDIVFTPGVNFTIDRRPVTVTPDAGQQRGYDGTAGTPTLTYRTTTPTATTGLVTGERLGGALSRNAGKDAASYAITQGTVTNTTNANYDITFTSGVNFTITPAALTVTANNASRYAGQANPDFSASYSGLAEGESASALTGSLIFTTPATTGSPVGSYTITPGGLSSGNYSIVYVGGVLTILPNPTYTGGLAGSGNGASNNGASGFGGDSLGFMSAQISRRDLLDIIGGGINTGGNALETDQE